MSEHVKDSINACLFSERDMKLKNIRFFRGGDDTIAPADICAEIHSAGMQRKAESAKHIGWPKSAQPKVDVRAFVADI